MAADGHQIIEMTIGEPDVPTPASLIDAATDAMRRGRTAYSSGRGEAGLRAALAERYAQRTGHPVSPRPDPVLSRHPDRAFRGHDGGGRGGLRSAGGRSDVCHL